MSRKGTFSSGNTCEAFVRVRVRIGHVIASHGLSLSHLCIVCHHLHLHEADAQQHERLWWLWLPGNHTKRLVQVLLVQRCWFAIMSSYITIKGWETPPKIRMVILPQAKGPPLSSGGQKWVFPLNILPALDYLQLPGAFEWFGIMDLFCRAQLICTWIHARFLWPRFSSEKSPIGLLLVMQKPHPILYLFWISGIQTLLRKCSKIRKIN